MSKRISERSYSLRRYERSSDPGFAEALALYARNTHPEVRADSREICYWLDRFASYEIDVFSDQVGGADATAVETVSIETTSEAPEAAGEIKTVPYVGSGQFVFLRIRQHDEDDESDRVWTAPVWFEASAAGGAGATESASDPAGLVASKNSKKYHAFSDCPFALTIADDNRITGAEAARGRTLCAKCAVRLGR